MLKTRFKKIYYRIINKIKEKIKNKTKNGKAQKSELYVSLTRFLYLNRDLEKTLLDPVQFHLQSSYPDKY